LKHISCFLDGDLDNWDVSSLPKEQRDIIEADSFWCLSKFLDGIQDNYIFAQLGIQHKVNQLKELIQRIDGKNWLKQNIHLHTLFKAWDIYGIKDWYFILVGYTVVSFCEPFISEEDSRYIK
jgi:TBC domain.